jgi:hypothetical protein
MLEGLRGTRPSSAAIAAHIEGFGDCKRLPPEAVDIAGHVPCNLQWPGLQPLCAAAAAIAIAIRLPRHRLGSRAQGWLQLAKCGAAAGDDFEEGREDMLEGLAEEEPQVGGG